MGNREDLLSGARRVILERGVAKATARDIAVAVAAEPYYPSLPATFLLKPGPLHGGWQP